MKEKIFLLKSLMRLNMTENTEAQVYFRTCNARNSWLKWRIPLLRFMQIKMKWSIPLLSILKFCWNWFRIPCMLIYDFEQVTKQIAWFCARLWLAFDFSITATKKQLFQVELSKWNQKNMYLLPSFIVHVAS